MKDMFFDARSFNQTLAAFDTSKVRSMTGMFMRAEAFNQNVSNFHFSNARDISRMFDGASSFSQDLKAWSGRISQGTNVDRMFYNTDCPIEYDPQLSASPQGPFCYPVKR
jgi:surface protein